MGGRGGKELSMASTSSCYSFTTTIGGWGVVDVEQLIIIVANFRVFIVRLKLLLDCFRALDYGPKDSHFIGAPLRPLECQAEELESDGRK